MKGKESKQVGFIAQDVVNSKVDKVILIVQVKTIFSE